jgi:hypothetical protein
MLAWLVSPARKTLSEHKYSPVSGNGNSQYVPYLRTTVEPALATIRLIAVVW